MKTTKRVLSIALALLLGLGLVVPSAALTSGSYPPVFKRLVLTPSLVFVGDTLTVEVIAEVPAGVDGVLSYAWYDFPLNSNITDRDPIATGSKFEWVMTEDMLKPAGSYNYIYVVVTNTYTDENGEVQTPYWYGGTSFSVSADPQWWEIPLAILFAPILLPIGFLGMGFVGPIMLLLAPFAIPIWLSELPIYLKKLFS
ncbi:MAG: hypothetical protein LBB75_00765 [Oscillospiraceae bacterium]|jgi:hypothetical protein|nr:hypothetical protein [Oscillospiraceae bacterium]